jgi:hypothetical protein
MSWKDDRDTLIAQTMAFVQSVANRRQSVPETAPRRVLLPLTEAQDAQSAAPEATRFAPVKMAELPPVVLPPVASGPASRPVAPGDVASEIHARIAGFRAHQERFNRERDEYFSTTIARLRATLSEKSPPRSDE